MKSIIILLSSISLLTACYFNPVYRSTTGLEKKTEDSGLLGNTMMDMLFGISLTRGSGEKASENESATQSDCGIPPDSSPFSNTSNYFGTLLLNSSGCPVFFFTDTDNSTYAKVRMGEYNKGWSFQDVGIGRFSMKDAVVFDANGKFHLASLNYPSANTLYYGTNINGSYVEQTVPGINPNNGYLSLGMDLSGKSHIISQFGSPAGTKYYSTNTSGSWVNQTISNDSNGQTSLAIDPAFPVTAIYHVWGSRDVYIADASNWVGTATLLENYSIDNDASTVIKVYLGKKYCVYAYTNDAGYLNGYLVVNDNSSGSWVKTYLENGSTRPIGVNLLLDENGKQHVVSGNRLGDLKYYTNKSGIWQNYFLLNGVQNGSQIDTIFYQDRILVAYTGTDLKYYFKTFKPNDFP